MTVNDLELPPLTDEEREEGKQVLGIMIKIFEHFNETCENVTEDELWDMIIASGMEPKLFTYLITGLGVSALEEEAALAGMSVISYTKQLIAEFDE